MPTISSRESVMSKYADLNISRGRIDINSCLFDITDPQGNFPDRAPYQTYSEDGRPAEPLFHATDDSPS